MARQRNNKGKLDIRIILPENLANKLRDESAKDFRSFAEQIRFVLNERYQPQQGE